MPKHKVVYIVRFETQIEADSPEDLQDKIFDINIPENDDNRYCENTFVVETIDDEDVE